MSSEKRCDICDKKFTGYGNNPTPLRGSVCCDECNLKIVVPIRIYQSTKEPTNALLFKQDGSVTKIKPKRHILHPKRVTNACRGLNRTISKKIT